MQNEKMPEMSVHHVDDDLFVRFERDGDQFMGWYYDTLKEGDSGPDGIPLRFASQRWIDWKTQKVRFLSAHYNLRQYVADVLRAEPDFFALHVVRLTRKRERSIADGRTVLCFLAEVGIAGRPDTVILGDQRDAGPSETT